jgi:hypothetical protein
VNASYALLLGAFICFVLAAVGAAVPRVNLVALGLALWVAAQVFF